MLVQMSVADLRALVAEAVTEALAEHEPAEPPALLTTDQLRLALQVSRSTLYLLRERGMPTTYVLDSPRFQLAEVLAWLASNSAQLRGNAETSVQKVDANEANAAVLPLPATGNRKPAELTTARPAGRSRR